MAFPSSSLICPVCSSPLQADAERRVLKCTSNHSFDRAKQGYLNLLLNNQKKSKAPGDSVEMVIARENFLSLEHYSPLTESLKGICEKEIKGAGSKPIQLCDIACGEGYYSVALADYLSHSKQTDVDLIGADISQPAIRHACRRKKDATWLVANAFHLPVASSSQDIVTHLFSRPCIEEAKRILKPGGLLIEVRTATEHLVELRRLLYPELKPKAAQSNSSMGLQPLEQKEISFHFELTQNQDILSLLGMTPHLFRAPKDRLEIVQQLQNIKLTAHFEIQTFLKKK